MVDPVWVQGFLEASPCPRFKISYENDIIGAKLFHLHGKFKDNETCTYAPTCTHKYASDIIPVHDYAVSINLCVFLFAIFTCTGMSIHRPVHEYSCACLYMPMYVCACVCACACIYFCMYVCVRT